MPSTDLDAQLTSIQSAPYSKTLASLESPMWRNFLSVPQYWRQPFPVLHVAWAFLRFLGSVMGVPEVPNLASQGRTNVKWASFTEPEEGVRRFAGARPTRETDTSPPPCVSPTFGQVNDPRCRHFGPLYELPVEKEAPEFRGTPAKAASATVLVPPGQKCGLPCVCVSGGVPSNERVCEAGRRWPLWRPS